MSKYRKAIITVGLCAVALTGCGAAKLPEVIERSTIVVGQEGNVTSYLVEAFDKDYYEIGGLTEMVMEDAAAFNAEAQSGSTVPVTVETVEQIGDSVKVIYQYSDADVYAEHMEGVLFYGTVQEAITKLYDVQSAIFTDVKDGTLAGDGLTTEAAEKHILITDGKAQIYCPYQVTHISEGAVYNEDGSVDTTQTDEIVFILMKK